ncbi:MAG: hypothetical protein CL781_06855 [Chloroflexi bacterium]|nr:hypothetical protein [Chloroflexota bacterium]
MVQKINWTYFLGFVFFTAVLVSCDKLPFSGEENTQETATDQKVLEPVYTPAPSNSNITPQTMNNSVDRGVFNGDNNSRGIIVNGTGLITVVPDVAILSIGVEVFSSTVKEARGVAAEAMDDVIEAVKGEGVLSKDIETTKFSIYPRYNYEEIEVDGRRIGQQVLTGYAVSNVAQIKIMNIEKVGTIIDEASESGGNYSRINGIDFIVNDPSPLMKGLRQNAVENAVEKAAQYAVLTGVSLGELISLNEVSSPQPMAQAEGAYGMRAMSSSVGSQISPGENILELTVVAKFSIE